jgi:hypothetical protein
MADLARQAFATMRRLAPRLARVGPNGNAGAVDALKFFYAAEMNLCGARVGPRIAALVDDAGLQELLAANSQTLRHVAASVAIEDSISSLDLCAAGVGATLGLIAARSDEALDMRGLAEQQDALPGSIREWLNRVTDSQEWREFSDWRDAHVHRTTTTAAYERFVGRDPVSGEREWTPGGYAVTVRRRRSLRPDTPSPNRVFDLSHDTARAVRMAEMHTIMLRRAMEALLVGPP